MVASAFGSVCVLSATRRTIADGGFFSRDFIVMVAAVLAGIAAALIISVIDYKLFAKLWPIIAAVGLLLMISLFFFGTGPGERPDVKTWLRIGSKSNPLIYFQPSEIVKIGFIITFGAHINMLKNKINQLSSILMLGAHAGIIILLVTITGDLGSALVFIVITAVMLFMSGLHWGYFAGGLALVAAASPLVWIYGLKQLHKDRILALIHPELYPDIILQQKRGINAIGAGGIAGQGIFNGAYTQSGAVPESQNDMIFTVVGEELGMLGCIAAVAVLLLIVLRIIHVGKKSKENTANLICCGVAAMIAGQVIINIGMCLMLLPVIGITLPFFSAGGSSNLCIYLGIGLVLSVYRQTRDQKPIDVKLYPTFKQNGIK